MKLFPRFRRLYIVVLFLALSQAAQGYTVADYYQAGLQLFNAKDYVKAVQYFSAALSLDPNNTASLQGRANCYYSLGQYQDALNDYEKVQAIAPSPQLSQFIQAVQAKVGPASPASGGTALPAAAPGESFNQGVALYQQRQYAAAVPDFQKAVQENPADANASYYLGASYLGLGDMKYAALNLELSNKKQPNPSVEAYVTQLKARMTPEDQQWVDAQVAASSSASASGISSPKKLKNFGIRFEPAIALVSLADFDTNAGTLKTELTQLQSSDPTITYQGIVPQGGPDIGVEPVLSLGNNLEIGLPLAFFPVGTASDAVSNASGSYAFNDSFAISAFSAGLNLRYILKMGDFQPFFAVGGLIEPISIDWTFNQTSGSDVETATGSFSGMAVGGQVQLGLDWHLGDTFAISPFAGYQFASANLFTGKAKAVQNGTEKVYNGQLELQKVGENEYAIFFDSSDFNPPAGSRPLQMDLSGIKAGVMISAFF